MSCSKFDTPTPAVKMSYPNRPDLCMMKNLKTHFGHPYERREDFFSRTEGDKTSYYIQQIFVTPNKKGIPKTAGIFLWLVLPGDGAIEISTPGETVKAGDGSFVQDIACKTAQATMLALPKACVAYPFTTNDPACLDSFTFTQGSAEPRCCEYYVMNLGKTAVGRTMCLDVPARSMLDLALTTRFIDSDTLIDMFEHLDNDHRFVERAPKNLTDAERKEHAKAELKRVRDEMTAKISPEHFVSLYSEWLDLNDKISPLREPAIFKDKIGRKILLPEPAVWDNVAGLLFLLATTKILKRSPENLSLALVACSAFIAEVTPKDARWGVMPPEKNDLDWVASTAEGKCWLIRTMETHGAAQDRFIAELQSLYTKSISTTEKDEQDACDRDFFGMLTRGLSEYEFGILGLVKAIVLRCFIGELKIPCGVQVLIEKCVNSFGLDWYFHMTSAYSIDPETDVTDVDPFAWIGSTGFTAKEARLSAEPAITRSLS
jgi:hypothetical protein